MKKVGILFKSDLNWSEKPLSAENKFYNRDILAFAGIRLSGCYLIWGNKALYQNFKLNYRTDKFEEKKTHYNRPHTDNDFFLRNIIYW
jgi:hypothetical protein